MEPGRNSQRKDSDKPANSEGKGAEARRGRVAVAGGGGGAWGHWTHVAALLENREIKLPAAHQDGLFQTMLIEADLGNLEPSAHMTTCRPSTY